MRSISLHRVRAPLIWNAGLRAFLVIVFLAWWLFMGALLSNHLYAKLFPPEHITTNTECTKLPIEQQSAEGCESLELSLTILIFIPLFIIPFIIGFPSLAIYPIFSAVLFFNMLFANREYNRWLIMSEHSYHPILDAIKMTAGYLINVPFIFLVICTYTAVKQAYQHAKKTNLQ